MSPDEKTFLTLSQAVGALAEDFRQYGPQPHMCHEIGPMILKDDFKTGMFNQQKRAWIARSGCFPEEPVADEAMGFYLIHMLETNKICAKDMAKICGRVFEAPALAGEQGGEPGIWVRSQMAGFACKRCGHCCTGLGNTCTTEDYRLWERLGRTDILAWVKPEPSGGNGIQYRIWVDPQTGTETDSCPFLGKQSGKKGFFCTIQEVKPRVCREYPFTRKHARLTGCPGFDE